MSVLCFAAVAVAQNSDALKQGFANPPSTARPLVWWHWMNGNITWDGAQKDMDWMKRVGIAGLQAFDVGQATPQVVETRLPYMTDGWKDIFRNTAAYADKVGLERIRGPFKTLTQPFKRLKSWRSALYT
jgi:alpha-L-rhamnosidase